MRGSEIIEGCLLHLGISAADFAKRLGFERPQVIYDIQKGKTKNISNSMADKIVAAFPEFNRVWLMTGEGEMLVSSHRHNACADDGDMVLLLPISAMGGPLAGFPTEGVLPYECERMASPVKGADFAITVSGDSMAPEYTSGTKLLIKRIDPSAFIEWGKVYVLDTCNGVIVKEVRKCDGKEGRIVCHSLNPDPKYVDFEVSMGDVYGMYRVLMSLTIR